ncbi:MAG TPA: DUF4199 domain-containing protein [Opitutaceae bacterium]|nr:DUF4199 domain-containing protein [Opitutaceae bacterium]
MNTYMLYGLAGAILGAVMNMVLFVLGLHGEKAQLMNDWKVGALLFVIGTAIGVAVIVLGLRAWREEAPGKGMSYGRGVGGGCLIGLWQGLGSMVFTILYGFVINPGFKDAMIAAQMAKMQEKGAPPEAYAMAEKFMGFMLSPIVQGVMMFFGTMFFAVVISLIAAAVLKREPQAPELPELGRPAGLV